MSIIFPKTIEASTPNSLAIVLLYLTHPPEEKLSKITSLIPEDSNLFAFITFYVWENEVEILGDSLFTYYREDGYPHYLLIERNDRKLRYQYSDDGMILIRPKLTFKDYLTLDENSLFFEDEFLTMLNSNDDGIEVTLDDINLIRKTSFYTTLHFGESLIRIDFRKWDDGNIAKSFEIVFGIETRTIMYKNYYVTKVHRDSFSSY